MDHMIPHNVRYPCGGRQALEQWHQGWEVGDYFLTCPDHDIWSWRREVFPRARDLPRFGHAGVGALLEKWLHPDEVQCGWARAGLGNWVAGRYGMGAFAGQPQ